MLVEATRRACNPSPCGPNADCKEKGGAGSCTCKPNYHGDPYTGCRPECLLSSDCNPNQACNNNNRCFDPCIGACAPNARCQVINHRPVCLCPTGATGNPQVSCSHLPPPCKLTNISFSSNNIIYSIFTSNTLYLLFINLSYFSSSNFYTLFFLQGKWFFF